MTTTPENETGRYKAAAADWLFYIPWGAILVVSVHDGVLVFVNRWTIAEDERNPLGRLLLYIMGGDVWLLLAAKGVGTIVAGALLLLVFWVHPRMGWTACLSLAFAQGLLLVFLTFA